MNEMNDEQFLKIKILLEDITILSDNVPDEIQRAMKKEINRLWKLIQEIYYPIGGECPEARLTGAERQKPR